MPDKGDEFMRRAEQIYGQRVQKAAIYLVGQIKELISVPSRSVKLREGRNGKIKKVLGARGDSRSKPGEPPHKDFGNLRGSIAFDFDPATLTARVGSPSKVARWMELGTPGGKIIVAKNKKVLADGAGNIFGKRVKQGAIRPRPFLRRSLKDSKERIRQIIEHGEMNDIK
jgi:hypothetical protein